MDYCNAPIHDTQIQMLYMMKILSIAANFYTMKNICLKENPRNYVFLHTINGIGSNASIGGRRI